MLCHFGIHSQIVGLSASVVVSQPQLSSHLLGQISDLIHEAATLSLLTLHMGCGHWNLSLLLIRHHIFSNLSFLASMSFPITPSSWLLFVTIFNTAL